MRIQHNIMAMSAYRNYTNNVAAMKKNLEKLSSGYKINRAGDDAAGLAISEKMRAQITGLETAQKNAKDGISLVQTAEGALTEVHDMLNRMVELATQSANGTYDNTTDRTQMQKEVNQLLDEIDRIADSSNFNGINLLDGSLGLNTDAFKFSDAAAVDAVTGAIDMTGKVANKTDLSPKWHSETANVSAATPKATIDLGDLKVKVAGATTTGATNSATVNFAIGNDTYTVTLDNNTTNEKEFTTAEIATALAAKLKNATASDGSTVSTGADAMKIGDATFTVTDKGDGTIELTYAGTKTDGTTYKAETTFTGNAGAASAINTNLGFGVQMTGVTNGTTTAGTGVVHMTTTVEHAKAETPATKAGIDVNLSGLVKDGYTLTIDGKTFTFKTKTDSTVTGTTDVIDVSAFDEADQVHAAADLLSKQAQFTGKDDRTWKIGVNGDGTTIHIEQTTASATGKALDSYEKVKGVVSAVGIPAAAKNVGTNITIDQSKITEGNTLNIDGKKYVFTKDLTGKTDDTTNDVYYVKYTENGTDAAANLKAKIGATAEVNGDVVTVRAATSSDPAPTVLGKGLTLQIGDTSDSFNQLNVSVQDMHSKSIGVGKLDISTEEAAQAAVNKIKNAINVVSDVRGTLGATQNRLDHTINNLSVMTENIQDAESTIRDVDVAEEMMAYTKNNILIQSAQAMLAQANQVPQGVLQLLG